MVCEAIGTAATPGLLCQPRVIVKMIVEKQMECRLVRETKVFGENLPQRHFCPSWNPTWPDPGLNPGRRGGKPATNRLSYGAAIWLIYIRIYPTCRPLWTSQKVYPLKDTVWELRTWDILDVLMAVTTKSKNLMRYYQCFGRMAWH
jgi:hypothetical protein